MTSTTRVTTAATQPPETTQPVTETTQTTQTPTTVPATTTAAPTQATTTASSAVQTVKNDDDSVIVELSSAVLPEGVTGVSVDVTPVGSAGENSEDYQQALLLISGDGGEPQNLVLYDLKLVDQDGNPIERFNGTVKVRIMIPAGMSGNLRVYWVNPETQELEDMNAVVDGGYLVFETSHFSYYAVAELSSAPAGQTGEESGVSLWWLLLIVPVALVVALLLGRARKKHR